jgi:pimeloyl-ACP methyl ester carboxylesterase
VSGYYYYPTARPDVLRGSQPAIPVIGDLMGYPVSPIISRMLWPLLLKKKLFAPAPVPDHSKRFPPWMAFRPLHLRASAAEIATVVPAAMGLSQRYRNLDVPLVIVAESDDRLVYFHKHSAHLYAELPESDLRTAKGSGHVVHRLTPDHAIEAISAGDAAGKHVQAAA